MCQSISFIWECSCCVFTETSETPVPSRPVYFSSYLTIRAAGPVALVPYMPTSLLPLLPACRLAYLHNYLSSLRPMCLWTNNLVAHTSLVVVAHLGRFTCSPQGQLFCLLMNLLTYCPMFKKMKKSSIVGVFKPFHLPSNLPFRSATHLTTSKLLSCLYMI